MKEQAMKPLPEHSSNRRSFVRGLAAACALTKIGHALAIRPSAALRRLTIPSRSFNGFHFGWVRDLPMLKTQQQLEHRRLFSLPPGEAPPGSVDLRSAMPPVYNQGQIGSCVANSVAALVQFARRKQGQLPDFVPSRLY